MAPNVGPQFFYIKKLKRNYMSSIFGSKSFPMVLKIQNADDQTILFPNLRYPIGESPTVPSRKKELHLFSIFSNFSITICNGAHRRPQIVIFNIKIKSINKQEFIYVSKSKFPKEEVSHIRQNIPITSLEDSSRSQHKKSH